MFKKESASPLGMVGDNSKSMDPYFQKMFFVQKLIILVKYTETFALQLYIHSSKNNHNSTFNYYKLAGVKILKFQMFVLFYCILNIVKNVKFIMNCLVFLFN